jgi:hypothetical protein
MHTINYHFRQGSEHKYAYDDETLTKVLSHSCGSSISADLVEGASVRSAESADVCHQEWNPHRNSDFAEPLCESRLLVRESSHKGGFVFFFLALLSLWPILVLLEKSEHRADPSPNTSSRAETLGSGSGHFDNDTNGRST